MTVEVWLRPWARFAPERRIALVPGVNRLPAAHDAPVFFHAVGRTLLVVDGRAETVEIITRMRQRAGPEPTDPGIETTLSILPLPVRRDPGALLSLQHGQTQVLWPSAPERFRDQREPQTDDERYAHALMQRAEAVWDRISDVDDVLADPARMWTSLRSRWTVTDTQEPRMDVIVKQARDLSKVLDALEMRPRRILRRVNRQTPVGRVQEIDRHSMLWLARQPGETLAERAGDDQRILAVAREENFDTLENRVLRAYGELASQHGLDYIARNKTRRKSRRAVMVETFAKKSRRLARELAARGVRAAEPGVTPNFVLQQNPLYHDIWQGWRELLKIERAKDELWRWQARSWEEFCGLAVMVALIGVPGASLVATAPIWFRDEHHRGRLIEADSPLGVIFLPALSLIVEVQLGNAGGSTANFAAPIWLRVGRMGEEQGFLSRFPIWPIWSPTAGLSSGEVSEVGRVVEHGRADMIRGGVVIRPAAGHEVSFHDLRGDVLALTLGTEGAALANGAMAESG